jgi:murein DD-endopeptidase MepM/ murein hydrolase activator NlpD
MKRISFIVVAAVVLLTQISAFPLAVPEPDLYELLDRKSIAESLNGLIRQIRDGQITRETARSKMQHLFTEAGYFYYQAGGTDTPKSEWYFPVAGSGPSAIAKGRSHGYSARGYDFYEGNLHKGHPSLDIFIRDRNQESRDDRSGKPVQVLSMTSGIVIAVEDNWETGDHLRGGRYLWVYDPGNDILVYYAHNERILVEVGDLVRPGESIATMGRSGYNAAKRRSPTHLHLTVLKVNRGSMMPIDVYSDIRKAKVKKKNYDRTTTQTPQYLRWAVLKV